MNAEEYRKKNPLGGPAKMFDAIADRIRAGEEYHAVLRDYNLLMLDPNRNSQPCPSCGARIEIGYRDSALRPGPSESPEKEKVK